MDKKIKESIRAAFNAGDEIKVFTTMPGNGYGIVVINVISDCRDKVYGSRVHQFPLSDHLEIVSFLKGLKKAERERHEAEKAAAKRAAARLKKEMAETDAYGNPIAWCED